MTKKLIDKAQESAGDKLFSAMGKKQPDLVIKHSGGGESKITFKSYQGRTTVFQGVKTPIKLYIDE